MNFKKYHKSKNLLSEKYENRSINGVGAFTIDSNYDLWLGEVVAGQTYTISNMDYVYGFFATKPMPNTGATYDGSRGYEMSGTAVVTVPSGCTWIAVRVLHNADNAMCNTGSQPLPYEPYDSEVWHDTPHYIHKTDTDTLTTLPADIYANDNNATSTTGIVNEPLRKIGDYADTVSGISIPTIAGANTLSIGTTLQPSEVTVNYKGWHPVADVHVYPDSSWMPTSSSNHARTSSANH